MINWERADLRGADLRGASFHLGSSRSGLVGSPIACEGSRTGFYTDDFNEQDFKAPEEIRKANLCGADLRGACLDGVELHDLTGRHVEDLHHVAGQIDRLIAQAPVGDARIRANDVDEVRSHVALVRIGERRRLQEHVMHGREHVRGRVRLREMPPAKIDIAAEPLFPECDLRSRVASEENAT